MGGGLCVTPAEGRLVLPKHAGHVYPCGRPDSCSKGAGWATCIPAGGSIGRQHCRLVAPKFDHSPPHSPQGGGLARQAGCKKGGLW